MSVDIYSQAKQACEELCNVAKLKEGSIVVVGCSSSEVAGGTIGKNSNLEVAEQVFKVKVVSKTEASPSLRSACSS